MGWPGCQYRFGNCRGRSVSIPAISINWTCCGKNGRCSGECGGGKSGAGGCVGNCFVFAAISCRSRLIICLASTCSYLGQQALYTGIRARSSPSHFSKTWIVLIRLIFKAISSLARRFSAAADWALHCGMSERRCARR